MKTIPLFILSIAFVACSTPQENTSNEDSESGSSAFEESGYGVFFENIADLDTLENPIITKMGVEGMTVEPKGKPKDGVGHHHLFINDGHYEEGVFIAADSTHIHYGGGETSDTLNLPAGKHLLTLQFADGMHMSYGKAWSKSYTVYVK